MSGNRDVLAPIIQAMPNLTWVHSTTAGVEHLLCAEIMENPSITLTNARGVFSRYGSDNDNVWWQCSALHAASV